jgi:hypothetical protein
MSFLAELVHEINKVRANPSSYVGIIEECKGYFNGKILKRPNSNVGIKTQEGADAYEECAKFLRTAESADETLPSKGLTKIANELLEVVQKDASQINTVDMSAIIDKYGSFTGAFNRVMECGGATPEQVIINLLVSDGDKSRSQRDALLNKSLKRIGVASGKHDIYKNATIIILCTQFQNTVDSDDSESYVGLTGAPKPEKRIQVQQPAPQPAPKPFDTGLPMLSQKIVDPQKNEPSNPEDNIVSVDKAERVVVEGGKRKKKITLTKHYKDGHTEKEVKFESL